MSSSMIANENAKKFNSEYVAKAREYVNFFLQEQPKGKKLTNMKEAVPMIESMALYLSVARSTLYEWEKEYPEFAAVVSDMRLVQASLTMNGALVGKFKERTAMLILNKHGYTEKIQTDVTNTELNTEERKTLDDFYTKS